MAESEDVPDLLAEDVLLGGGGGGRGPSPTSIAKPAVTVRRDVALPDTRTIPSSLMVPLLLAPPGFAEVSARLPDLNGHT